MPTILRFGAYRIMIYVDDHYPAHVHVIGRDEEIIFNLDCVGQGIWLREKHNVSRVEQRRIRAFLLENLAILCAAWEQIHGEQEGNTDGSEAQQ